MRTINKVDENAGDLDERITIARETLVSDGQGGNTVTWQAQATMWARVIPVSGKERDQGDQTESPIKYRFKMRRTTASEAILAKDIVSWRSKIFNIMFVEDKGPRSQYISIEAMVGVAPQVDTILPE